MIIDLTTRYSGMGVWMPTPIPQVQALIVHHWAGWYGPELTPQATQAQETAQIDRCAADHFERFGTGPGYNYIAFPSGRVYAVRKWGQYGAHTKGRAPEEAIPDQELAGRRWNEIGRAVAAAGNGNRDDPTDVLEMAIRDALLEMRNLGDKLIHPDAPTYVHRTIPTVNSAGVAFKQGTACPGDHLAGLVREGRFHPPSMGAEIPCDEKIVLARAAGRMLGVREGRAGAVTELQSKLQSML